MNSQDGIGGQEYRELRLLAEVQRSSSVTQRGLARRAGIALGLTNLLLQRLVQKGYVRATRAGWRRWLYALTPAGFSHKVQLTAAYIHRVVEHYRTVRETLRGDLEHLGFTPASRVALYGTGEFAELVYLGLKETGIEQVDIFDSGNTFQKKFLGLPVRHWESLQPERYDRVIVARLDKGVEVFDMLRKVGVTEGQFFTFFGDREALSMAEDRTARTSFPAPQGNQDAKRGYEADDVKG